MPQTIKMTIEELEKAKELIKTQSPLSGGDFGVLLRKYLKYQDQRIEYLAEKYQNKGHHLHGYPIFDTSFRGF